MFKLLYFEEAQKDMEKLSSVEPHIRKKVLKLLKIIEEDPYRPPYKTLRGKLKGALARKVNDKHRLVYEVLPEEKLVKVILVLSHYRD